MSKPLSPQAQAVHDAFAAAAFQQTFKLNDGLSAALRAAADQVLKSDRGEVSGTIEDDLRAAERVHMLGAFYAIAAELEQTP